MPKPEFKITLSGFKTKEQAKMFLKWYEGQGEQSGSLDLWMEQVGVKSVLCDCKTGMIEHPDGFEYKVNIFETKK